MMLVAVVELALTVAYTCICTLCSTVNTKIRSPTTLYSSESGVDSGVGGWGCRGGDKQRRASREGEV